MHVRSTTCCVGFTTDVVGGNDVDPESEVADGVVVEPVAVLVSGTVGNNTPLNRSSAAMPRCAFLFFRKSTPLYPFMWWPVLR